MRSPPRRRRAAKRGATSAPFLALVACAAVYVAWSGQALPAMVASHFGAGGEADGFMPRLPYIGFMLVIVVLVPTLVGLLPGRAFRSSGARLHLPNADYWLASGRREATIRLLSRQLRRFAMLLLAFLCYAHGLVVEANQSTPPVLPSTWFIGGLAVFLTATLVWVLSLVTHFRNVPR